MNPVRPVGRPGRRTGRTALLQVRMSAEELEQVAAHAGSAHVPDWVRDRLLRRRWLALPIELDEERPTLREGDTYRVRLASGEEADTTWRASVGGGCAFFDAEDTVVDAKAVLV